MDGFLWLYSNGSISTDLLFLWLDCRCKTGPRFPLEKSLNLSTFYLTSFCPVLMFCLDLPQCFVSTDGLVVNLFFCLDVLLCFHAPPPRPLLSFFFFFSPMDKCYDATQTGVMQSAGPCMERTKRCVYIGLRLWSPWLRGDDGVVLVWRFRWRSAMLFRKRQSRHRNIKNSCPWRATVKCNS